MFLQNEADFDWNDVRFFLAVARAGTTLGAARALGVNQTTVARRVAVLEQSLGLTLFDRRMAGYALTEAGCGLQDTAEQVETAAVAVAAQAGAMRRCVSGVIRVTTNEGLANGIMAPALSQYHDQNPSVRIDLVVDERRLDLTRGAADVALRTGDRPQENGLVARRLLSLGVALYCSRRYAEQCGQPDSVECLAHHRVIGVEGPVSAVNCFVWLHAHVPEKAIVTRISSITNLIASVRSGLGVTVMPCFLADPDSSLIRCTGPIDGIASDVWLVMREDQRHVPRVRSFVDFLADYVIGQKPLLTGRACGYTTRSQDGGMRVVSP